jgi:nucleoid DNA-binding protein
MSKSEFINAIAERSELSRKQVSAVCDAMQTVVAQQLGKKGPGEVTIPGIAKLNVTIKPAVPERQGINPFTKQPTVFKAKPERKVVKSRPVKAVKDAV